MDKAMLLTALTERSRRPSLPLDTPDVVRALVEEMWQTHPSLRPTAQAALYRINELYTDTHLQLELDRFLDAGGASSLPRPVRDALR
eukprot:scaffold7068_cov301-Pinguiococcus_pyrenoidosus.AAC.3